ncbi:MAG: sulfite oxidase-like oxidoreductase [Anaerolineae bacterium]|nr:sulfite oxidase-like oxidoreductase [Anaerolineae bacterium]
MAKPPAERLPPGQYLEDEMPVLHYGPVPRFDPKTWDFRVFGLVANPLQLRYDDILAMPAKRIVADVHCVTHWSVLDTVWEGVPARDILALAQPLPEARFVLVHAEHGYTTNLPLERLMDDDVLLAYRYRDAPLAPEHGYPLRLVVPKLYFWKSAKWVRGFELMARDRKGFWESRGYHNDGDPWKEERYG